MVHRDVQGIERGREALLRGMWVEARRHFSEAVQPRKDLRPDLDHIGPMPYTAFQAARDPTAPPGRRS